jgi:hypothetical protein
MFFAWHRAELYFHERILGWHLGDDTFRLPYWNWEMTATRTMPPVYSSSASPANALWNSTRVRRSGDAIDAWRVADHSSIMLEEEFENFSATAEGGPHGSVHVWVNGDMGAFATAARDPIFFTHHCNVDKMWSDWQADGHADLSDAGYRATRFSFFDEGKKWISISVADLLDHEAKLRYRYSSVERTIDVRGWRVVRRWSIAPDPGPFRIPPEVLTTRSPETLRATRIVMRIVKATVPGDVLGTFRIVASSHGGSMRDPPVVLGAVSFVPNSVDHARHGVPERRAFSASVDITSSLRSLTASRDLELQLIPDQQGRLDPARAIPVGRATVEIVERRMG